MRDSLNIQIEPFSAQWLKLGEVLESVLRVDVAT